MYSMDVKTYEIVEKQIFQIFFVNNKKSTDIQDLQ